MSAIRSKPVIRWTAQREGRAKDGRDLTDPALIKMLSLAYRKDIPDIGRMIERLSIVPVAVRHQVSIRATN